MTFTSPSDNAVQRMAALEAEHRDLVTLYDLPADTAPPLLVERIRLERDSLDRLLKAGDEVRDARFTTAASEIRSATGRVQGEMEMHSAPSLPKPGRETFESAGFTFTNASRGH